MCFCSQTRLLPPVAQGGNLHCLVPNLPLASPPPFPASKELFPLHWKPFGSPLSISSVTAVFEYREQTSLCQAGLFFLNTKKMYVDGEKKKMTETLLTQLLHLCACLYCACSGKNLKGRSCQGNKTPGGSFQEKLNKRNAI